MANQNAATLRLMSDLREMQKDAPEVSAAGATGVRAPPPATHPQLFSPCNCGFRRSPRMQSSADARGLHWQGASAAPLSEENIFVWAATIFGPSDTPWEGGIFSLRMTFCDQYPDKPPKVRFTTKVFHPNGVCHGPLNAVHRARVLVRLFLLQPALAAHKIAPAQRPSQRRGSRAHCTGHQRVARAIDEFASRQPSYLSLFHSPMFCGPCVRREYYSLQFLGLAVELQCTRTARYAWTSFRTSGAHRIL